MRKEEEEHAECLVAIRARIQRSLADPRPDVPLTEAFDRLARLHAITTSNGRKI